MNRKYSPANSLQLAEFTGIGVYVSMRVISEQLSVKWSPISYAYSFMQLLRIKCVGEKLRTWLEQIAFLPANLEFKAVKLRNSWLLSVSQLFWRYKSYFVRSRRFLLATAPLWTIYSPIHVVVRMLLNWLELLIEIAFDQQATLIQEFISISSREIILRSIAICRYLLVRPFRMKFIAQIMVCMECLGTLINKVARFKNSKRFHLDASSIHFKYSELLSMACHILISLDMR